MAKLILAVFRYMSLTQRVTKKYWLQAMAVQDSRKSMAAGPGRISNSGHGPRLEGTDTVEMY